MHSNRRATGRGGLGPVTSLLKSGVRRTDAPTVGDRLRQIFYPMVVPLIVATIWMCGWVRQQEDRMARAVFAPPPEAAAVRGLFLADADEEPASDSEEFESRSPSGRGTPRAFAAIAQDSADEP